MSRGRSEISGYRKSAFSSRYSIHLLRNLPPLLLDVSIVLRRRDCTVARSGGSGVSFGGDIAGS